MALFLFIIAMEELHLAIDNLIRKSLFYGAKINNIIMPYLFYANDVMIVGDWSQINLDNISNALRFLYCISGLKINFDKSSIIGVGVKSDEAECLANKIGCKVEILPFKYLGVPIGARSGGVAIWGPIIPKFQNRLA
uniref:uncharacterized protein LOC122609330 n=1 Tax=Erigeron canadensis TaxID=72917 RepID=UPI001CB97D68|nr:uncharacterized protein LOC122609330 [Erigeron canadensis]